MSQAARRPSAGGPARGIRVASALVRACHPLPTLAVTVVMTAYAVSLGWRGAALIGAIAAVLVGQLSVGWSNDAHDASLDARSSRTKKPTVSGDVTARTLWAVAVIALTLAMALSWMVAGPIGGSFHVLAVVMAWAYNLALSRTSWSWLPYAVAFGVMPAFFSWGLDGQPPPLWAPVVFALVGVSGHLANALPDIEHDSAASVGGLAVRLGARRTRVGCWILSGLASGILGVVLWPVQPLAGAAVVGAWLVAAVVAVGRPSPQASFRALLAVVAIDVVALVLSAGA